MREPSPNRATFFDFGRAAVAIYPFFRRAVFFSKPIIPKIISTLNFIIKKNKTNGNQEQKKRNYLPNRQRHYH